MSALKKIGRALLPPGALVLGIAVLVLMVKTRPTPDKKPREERGALVQTGPVSGVRERLRVVESGSVIPAEQVVLAPEVSGRVLWQHKEFVPGGRFKKGEVILRIDVRDHSLALRQQSANVGRAELELKVEKARTDVAKEEWAIVGDESKASADGRALALREPQLETAKVNLEAARSAQAQARLAVSRSALTSPFNAFVKQESVDIGQLVSPQMQLATLVGTDRFWVQVSVPVDKLSVIEVPGLNTAAALGSPATIVQELGGQRIERSGHVIRLLGDLDPVGRMARLLVAIEDPFGLKTPAPAVAAESTSRSAALPLLLGAFVEVAIEARVLEDVVEVPRLALRDGDSVYVVGPDSRLEVRAVEVAWRRASTVLVKKGVSAGEEVVLSRLPSAVPGMLLRKVPSGPKDQVLGQR